MNKILFMTLVPIYSYLLNKLKTGFGFSEEFGHENRHSRIEITMKW